MIKAGSLWPCIIFFYNCISEFFVLIIKHLNVHLKLYCIQLLKSKFLTEFTWDNNSLMSVFVADKSPHFSIICYLWVQDWSMGISASAFDILKEALNVNISFFSWLLGFGGLQTFVRWVIMYSFVEIHFRWHVDRLVVLVLILLVFTLWFFWLRCRRTCESMLNFKHWNNVRMFLSDFIRLCLGSFAYEANERSSFQIGLN